MSIPGGVGHSSRPTQGTYDHCVLPPPTANTSHFPVLAEIGWRAEFLPADHSLSEFEFDVIIGADGRRNTLEGENSFFCLGAEDGARSRRGCFRKRVEK